eukprot:gene230-807_t
MRADRTIPNSQAGSPRRTLSKICKPGPPLESLQRREFSSRGARSLLRYSKSAAEADEFAIRYYLTGESGSAWCTCSNYDWERAGGQKLNEREVNDLNFGRQLGFGECCNPLTGFFRSECKASNSGYWRAECPTSLSMETIINAIHGRYYYEFADKPEGDNYVNFEIVLDAGGFNKKGQKLNEREVSDLKMAITMAGSDRVAAVSEVPALKMELASAEAKLKKAITPAGATTAIKKVQKGSASPGVDAQVIAGGCRGKIGSWIGVGGFLAGFAMGKTIEQCCNAGNAAAGEIIQQSGCQWSSDFKYTWPEGGYPKA